MARQCVLSVTVTNVSEKVLSAFRSGLIDAGYLGGLPVLIKPSSKKAHGKVWPCKCQIRKGECKDRDASYFDIWVIHGIACAAGIGDKQRRIRRCWVGQ